MTYYITFETAPQNWSWSEAITYTNTKCNIGIVRSPDQLPAEMPDEVPFDDIPTPKAKLTYPLYYLCTDTSEYNFKHGWTSRQQYVLRHLSDTSTDNKLVFENIVRNLQLK